MLLLEVILLKNSQYRLLHRTFILSPKIKIPWGSLVFYNFSYPTANLRLSLNNAGGIASFKSHLILIG